MPEQGLLKMIQSILLVSMFSNFEFKEIPQEYFSIWFVVLSLSLCILQIAVRNSIKKAAKNPLLWEKFILNKSLIKIYILLRDILSETLLES